jgi:SMODS-associating 2TM, beta-strand rich effector domain
MDFRHYKTGVLYFVFTVVIGVGTVLLFTIQDWVVQATNKAIDPKIQLMIFIFSSCLSPTVLFIFFTELDKVWWKSSWTNLLIDVPDLNGWYYGSNDSIIRAQNNQPVHKDLVLEVMQTGSDIKINLYYYEEITQHFSRSENVTSTLVLDGIQPIIYYNYRNLKDPRKSMTQAPSSIGAAELRVINYGRETEIEGTYFNQRGNTGIIKVKFIDRTLTGRFRFQNPESLSLSNQI